MLLALVIAPAVLFALPMTAGQAVTGGAPDGTAHPYVASLIPPGATTPHCTAVLVTAGNGKKVALTDAHCLFRNGRRTGTGVKLVFAPTFSSTAPTYGGKFYISPSYNPAISHLHDVAAIVLTTVPAVGSATLAPVGTAGSLDAGTTTTTVGTGQPYPGQRRVAAEIVTSASSSWLYLKAGTGNTCTGDSGGPDLLNQTSSIVALTDQGTCSYDQDTRVDTNEMHQFASQATAWPTTSPSLTLRLSSSKVSVGTTVVASGSTSPLYSGETILRQGYYGGAWHTWASTTVSLTGTYRFTLKPTIAATDVYRVLLRTTATHPAGASRSVTLTVTM